MDWLRIFVAAYAVLFLVSVASSVAQIGKPRKPVTAQSVGCGMLVLIPTFVGFLLVWQRLGTT